MATKTRLFCSMVLIGLTVILSSCIVIHTEKSPPPGHAKEIYGEQSAKNQAPGQVKKATGKKSAKQYAPGQNK